MVYGPCVEPGEPADYWAELHARLAGVAALWGKADAAGVESFTGRLGLPSSPAIEALGDYTSELLRNREMTVRMHYPWSSPAVAHTTLRAYLACQALNQAEFAARHHRCARCSEWHEVLRNTGKFCGSACRNEKARSGPRTAFQQQSDRDG
jgi:hypothetical protein